MLQTEAGQGVRCPPSFGPDEAAAPFQKLYEGRAGLRSELDPACTWLSLAGRRPCGLGEVSPDVGGGRSGRLRLRPGHGGTS